MTVAATWREDDAWQLTSLGRRCKRVATPQRGLHEEVDTAKRLNIQGKRMKGDNYAREKATRAKSAQEIWQEKSQGNTWKKVTQEKRLYSHKVEAT